MKLKMGEKKRGKVVLVSVLLCALMFSNVIFSAAKCLPRNMKMQIQNRSSIAALDSPFVFLVQGDVLHTGVFYAVVSIGTPAKSYFLDIDTGSELTWVQCSPNIANLPKEPRYLEGPNPLYKPPPANNICPPPHQNGGCEYEVSYADSGSSIGLLVQDSFLLQSIPPPSYSPTLTFGCGYHQEYSGPSPPPFVDGVFGLGNGETSILMQLNKQGLIPKVVGHCLSTNGGDGFLFLGNPQQFLDPTSLFLWTHILPNPNLEQHVNLVGPTDLYYGDQALGANGLNVVFDSGTTFNYFNSQTYQATFQLLNELANRVGVEAEDNYLPECWKPNNSIDDFKNSFNSLQLRFTNENANVYFALAPNDYLVDSPDGNVCLGILDGEVFGPELQNLNIIGDISLLDKLVIYDYEKQQIGWGSIECSRRPYF